MGFSKKVMGKEVGDASVYAKPHTMSGKAVNINDVGLPVKMPSRENWAPLNGGVAIGNNGNVKTDGITMRGYGAATKGIKSRGPMA